MPRTRTLLMCASVWCRTRVMCASVRASVEGVPADRAALQRPHAHAAHAHVPTGSQHHPVLHLHVQGLGLGLRVWGLGLGLGFHREVGYLGSVEPAGGSEAEKRVRHSLTQYLKKKPSTSRSLHGSGGRGEEGKGARGGAGERCVCLGASTDPKL
jgi:hypothetical protein